MRVTAFYFFAFLIALPFISHSQDMRNCNYERPREADQWMFGNMAYLDFSYIDPAVSTTAPFPLYSGVSAISNAQGELMLFSNGQKIWNGNNQLVADGLNGNLFATQSSLILPDPGNEKRYYIFTLDMYLPPVFTDGINYSIVSFEQNPAGTVVSKNNLLATKNSQKITGTKHANNYEYWVITHGFGEDEGNVFNVWMVSDTGVAGHQRYVIGYKHQGDDNNGAGYMKLSPDGQKLALVVPADGVIELFDFNKETGEISNPVTSPGQYDYPFGVEFSPDNSKLYISTSPIGSGTNYLYQFDISSPDPLANPEIIHQFDVSSLGLNDSLMGALQLAVDGKIYLSKFRRGLTGKHHLGVIFNPDRPGSECNYNSLNYTGNNGLDLGNAESLIGLPGFVTTFLDIPHFTFYNQCHHDTTEFRITNTANIDDTHWDFDDPNGDLVNGVMYDPSYVFSDPGDYNVQLTETFNGLDYTYEYPVRIHPLPYVDLGNGSDTIYILPNSSVRLDAGDYDFYYWEPDGSTDRYLDVTAEGLYSVIVTDSNCCRNYDEVYIVYSDLFFPTAFSPDSPIAGNREFKALGVTSALAEYHLVIYNRWGQRIFETDDPGEGWNGTYKGAEVPAGTYIWLATYKSFESGVQESIEVVNRGTVTLVK